MSLIHKISCISKKERELITQSELLDQKRILYIQFDDGIELVFDQLKYCMKLCTSVVLLIKKFERQDKFIFQYLMDEYSHKIPVNCVNIWLRKKFDSTQFMQSIQQNFQMNIKKVNYVFEKELK